MGPRSLPDYLLAIDQGTTSTRAIVFDAALGAGRDRAAGVPPDLSGARAWSSTTRRRSGRRRSRPCAPRWRRPAPAAQRHRGDRHHQPARDHDRLGPRHRQADPQRHRLAGPPHRRRLRGAARGRATRPLIAARTGLLLDPYFSATKIAWLLDHVDGRARARREPGRLAFGTVDSFLLWRLTGGKVHATDATNAARTLLLDIRTGRWDAELLRAVRRAARRCCRRCATAPATSARPRPICSAGRSASSASPATSRPRPSGRAASRPA